MLNISRKKTLANERVLQMAGENRTLPYSIQRRKIEYLGHVMRHNELVKVIMQEKVEGTKAIGRQRKKYLDDICTWTNQNKKNVTIRKCKEGESIT